MATFCICNNIVAAAGELRAQFADRPTVKDLKEPAYLLLLRLSGMAQVSPPSLTVRAAAPNGKKYYGCTSPDRVVTGVGGLPFPSERITLCTRDPKTRELLRFEEFLETLLHEWVHHFDLSTYGRSEHNELFRARVVALLEEITQRMARMQVQPCAQKCRCNRVYSCPAV